MNTKPLSEWTLGEAQKYCEHVGCASCKIGNGHCPINGSPNIWDLSEPPRWTEQDKEDAKSIKAIFPESFNLEAGRLEDGRLKLFVIQGLSFVLINDMLLPSLKTGESATLDEIIGGGE